MVTAASACFDGKKLRGVAGVDILMTDLLSDVQYFNQAGPKSYAFLFHAKTGNTMSHPKLPTPEAITEDPNSVNILELEQGKEFKKLIEEVQSTGQLRLVLKLHTCDLGVQVPGLAAIVAGEVNLRANVPTWTKINGRCREVAVSNSSTVLTNLLTSGILLNYEA